MTDRAEFIAAQRTDHACVSCSLMGGPRGGRADVLRASQPPALADAAAPSRPRRQSQGLFRCFWRHLAERVNRKWAGDSRAGRHACYNGFCGSTGGNGSRSTFPTCGGGFFGECLPDRLRLCDVA